MPSDQPITLVSESPLTYSWGGETLVATEHTAAMCTHGGIHAWWYISHSDGDHAVVRCELGKDNKPSVGPDSNTCE